MATIQFVTAYGEHLSPGIDCSDVPSMTKQSFKDECDVNNIMARFERTGVLDYINENAAQFGEVPALDFQTAMNIVAKGNSLFEQMPGAQRAAFENDPVKFLAFMEDGRNRDKAIELGLIDPPAISAALEGATPSETLKEAPTPLADGLKG